MDPTKETYGTPVTIGELKGHYKVHFMPDTYFGELLELFAQQEASLLARYIKHVDWCEGMNYISQCNNSDPKLVFTKSEIERLQELAVEQVKLSDTGAFHESIEGVVTAVNKGGGTVVVGTLSPCKHQDEYFVAVVGSLYCPDCKRFEDITN